MIEYLLINALLILGVHVVTREGYLLEGVEKFWESRPMKIAKPLTECPVCMSSLWGIGFFLFTPLPWEWLPVWPFILAGLMEIITSTIWKDA